MATSLTGVVAGIQVFESQRTNGRYLGDVLIEIGLLDAAILERDLTIERGRDAEDDGALNLRPYGIGIDHGAAVNGSNRVTTTAFERCMTAPSPHSVRR